MKVPLLDLKTQYLDMKEELDRAMIDVAESQQFILGPYVQKFEEELAEYCGCRYALGANSGSDALLVALMAADIGPGDEVITSAFTFFATAGSIARLGAAPVFVDIDPATFNIDPSLIESAITPRTKAIMPVHLYGQCADMKPIMEISKKHGLAVIEDAAQSIGAQDKTGPAGSLGMAGCLSFYPTKNLGAFGQGGATLTNDESVYKRMRALREHGETERYFHAEVGGNFRIDAIQAAVLSVKLKRLESWTERRQSLAALYTKLIEEKGLAGEFITPPAVTQPKHVFNLYTIRAERRDELRAHLNEKEVASGVYYPLALHRQKCFEGLGYSEGDLPETERACREVLSLPVCPELTEDQITYAVECVEKFYCG